MVKRVGIGYETEDGRIVYGKLKPVRGYQTEDGEVIYGKPKKVGGTYQAADGTAFRRVGEARQHEQFLALKEWLETHIEMTEDENGVPIVDIEAAVLNMAADAKTGIAALRKFLPKRAVGPRKQKASAPAQPTVQAPRRRGRPPRQQAAAA